MVYIDSMAGCGITKTKSGTILCGSSPSVLLTSIEKKYPFHSLVAVEIDKFKAESLKARLDSIKETAIITVINDDINNVANELCSSLATSFCLVFIDPQAFQGMKWVSLKPLLCLKGDVMVNFFEGELFRMKGSGLSDDNPASAKATSDRIDDLLGTHDWIKCNKAEELTEIFINRIKSECGKEHHEEYKIYRSSSGNYYKILLFTSKKVEQQAKRWKENMERRLSGIDYDSLSMLFEIKEGKTASLDYYY